MAKAPVQDCVSLGIGRISGVRKTIQKVGRCNAPPCLRNRLFPNSAQALLGVVGMLDSVFIDLQDLDSREGGI